MAIEAGSETLCDTKSETKCRRLTGPGRSAIAVIEVQGDQAVEIVGRCVTFATSRPLRVGVVRYAHWHGGDANPDQSESVVVTLTRDDTIEVHCHGGQAATDRVLEDLGRMGARVQRGWSDVPTTHTLLQWEATEVLAHCTTTRLAAIALDQVRGALSNWVELCRSRLANAMPESSQLPLVLDSIREQAHAMSVWGETCVRLSVPFRVVLVGAPNVGKSTLMNAMLGWDRSIMHDEAGTTRDVLHGHTVLDGLPIRLSDTAGIRESDEEIEREGIKRSAGAIREADVVVAVADSWPQLAEIVAMCERLGQRRVISLVNKIDRLDAETKQSLDSDALVVKTIATSGEGIDELQRRIVETLSSGLPPRGEPVPINERQLQAVKRLATSPDAKSMLQIMDDLQRGETL